MVREQDKTLKAVQIAIQMEIDGKEYYLKASQRSSHELGRKLLQSLAAEEDLHQKKFLEIYESTRSKKVWPTVTLQPNRSGELKMVFVRAARELGPKVRVPHTELGAIEKAMDMENKSYDFYQSQSKTATHDAERDFYLSVASEEKEHHQLLLDYYEYLKDPAGYFVKKEHPSLDGG